ncbi:alpha-L-fucosidase [Hephaestia sp. GCM10023244]|uniref:alpha-L-fucosidase n=1 Tax=unclassified Hephaestia TaxID=2631281 RepID=UPI002077174E|nr:alpha-L-fucosidase [Hephaestia sp. MAHUQ-44]MCM8730279.1 alpha-L-fucosidase [Hephaestia sp. MAHUQ-44]
MLTMNRKEFLRTGLSTMAVAGLPASAAAAAFGAADAPGDPITVTRLDPVIRLYPAKASSRSGELRFGPAELSIMLPFLGAGELLWEVEVAEPGEYDLALCYSTTKPGTPVTIEAGPSKVNFAAPVTEGYFYPDPNGPSENPGDPDSDSFWTMREYYLFERVPVPGRIKLVRGVNVVRLKVAGEKGKEIFRLRSLELTPVAQRAAIEADKQRARSRRANTDWFADAGYGMWFHFLNLTMPRHGPQVPYEQSINALDARKMAKMVADCGASYLIWAVNHGHPTCPAPIKSWEKLHPGWTTKRDFIGELADALGKHGIRLMLYMNCPGIGKLEQQAGTALDLPAFSEAEYSNQLADVFREFGNRYGSRVAGYWFDSWFQTTESYPNLPHEALFDAVKTGNPDRMVALNYWAFPVEVEWQDYWAGEITDLPAKPFKSRYIKRGAGAGLQAHSALRFDAPWFHIKQDTPMDAPRYSAAELGEYIRTCQADRAPVTLGVGIFQDGTIAEESFTVLKQLRKIVRTGRKP